jgi:predicted nucleic acid-binding protein
LKAALAGPIYLDASALAKLYLPEPRSDQLNRALAGRRDLLVSDLAVTEITSSLARRTRDGSVTRAVAGRVHRGVLGHLATGVFQRVDLLPATHRHAERLLLSLGQTSLRAADALHLALALQDEALCIATFDQRLAEASRVVGLVVFP